MSRLNLIFLIVMLQVAPLFSAVPDFTPANPTPITIQDFQNLDNGIQLTLQVEEPDWIELDDGLNPLQMANYPDAGALEEEGYPVVPVVGRMFRIPPTSGVTIEVIEADYETFTDVDYAVLMSGELDEFAWGRAQVVEDEWYPGVLAEAASPSIFHDFRVSNLLTYPIQVNTARNEIRFYHTINVRIRYEGVDDRNTLEAWPTKISRAFLPWYRQLMDWNEQELDEYQLYYGKVQVVCTNALANSQNIQPWFEWKRQKGWDLQLLTEDDAPGFSANSIRNELVARWDASDEKYDYIVVIGDNNGAYGVPPAQGQGDQLYSQVAGNDDLADVGLGRISISDNGQLDSYIAKVLSYERDPNMANTDWYRQGVVTRSNNTSSVSKLVLLRSFMHGMLDLGYTQVDTCWIANQANGVAINSINQGVSVYATRGYLGSGLNGNQINGLTNANMTPVVVDVTCGTGSWAGGTATSESYMRAGTVNTPTGAIGAFGMATTGTNPLFNNPLCGGTGHALLTLRLPALGDMSLGGRINAWNNFHGHNDGPMNNFLQWYNLMGDPLVWAWTDIPQDLDVTAAHTIELGRNNYNVIVEKDGEPLPEAWVTLYKVDDDEEVIARGLTDDQGFFSFDFPVRFPGPAMLTVTSPNCKPERIEIQVVQPTNRVGYTSITYLDDGTQGTSGNGNGIAEAGETIGLIIEARNYGQNTESNVRATITTDDPWVRQIEGTADFGQLAAGETGTGQNPVLVTLLPSAQNDWNIHLDIHFASDQATYDDSFVIPVSAPQFAMVSINGLDNFDPGGEADISIRLRNVGGSPASSSTAILQSLDPNLSVPQPTGTFASMDIGDERSSTNFTVSAHPNTIPGHQSLARLILTTADDQTDTTYITVTIGTKESTDPAGPDGYGYYAFDQTDTDYMMAPQYEWIEVNPDAPDADFQGTRLDLEDPAENQDAAVTVDLPFPVQYYGDTFDQITVCSNGFIAMGSQADMYANRNWTIPSPIGPNYMIAPYWEELRINGDAGVYIYHDVEQGRMFIEWYHTTAGSQPGYCTFEIVLYSQDARPTMSGDNDFLFQYQEVNHSQNAMQYDLPYWTTGIENGSQTDGILLSYYNEYYPGACTIEAETAILFSTNIVLITGNIAGTVTDLATGEPMEGVTIHTSAGNYEAVTDENGSYLLEEVIIGVHDVTASKIGFNDAIVTEIEVFEDQTTMVDFSMTHPEFNIDTDQLVMRMAPDEENTETIHIDNTGNGPLEFNIDILFTNPGGLLAANPGRGELDDPWDLYDSFDLTINESRNRGVTYMDNSFWVCGSYNNDNGYNRIYRYNRQGVLLGSYLQPVENHSAAGFMELASDGVYLYGSDRGQVYQMEFDGESVETVATWQAPMNLIKFMTYDEDMGLLWLGHSLGSVYGIDTNGTIVTEYPMSFDARGLAFYPEDPDGYTLYFMCPDPGNQGFTIRKMDPESGDVLEVISFADESTPGGVHISNVFNPLVYTFMAVMDNGAQDELRIWELDLNSRWIDIDPRTAVVEAGNEQAVDITVNTTAMLPSVYQAWLQMNHNSIEQSFVLPLRIEVQGQGAGEDHFTPVEPTGTAYTVIVNDAEMDGVPLIEGDEIGVFDGDLCVGVGDVAEEWPLEITVWGETAPLPGFTTGNPMQFALWSYMEDRELPAVPEYLEGEGTFGDGDQSVVVLSAGAMPRQTVPIHPYRFDLVSTYVEPEFLNASAVFGLIEGIQIVYQNNGRIFIPPYINTIGNIDLSQGYLILCDQESDWLIEGHFVDPATPIILPGNQWSWMGYPIPFPVPIELALSSVVDQIDIVMNDEGGFWIPDVFDGIGTLHPGEGYYLFAEDDLEFQFDIGTLRPMKGEGEYTQLDLPQDAPAGTGIPYLVRVMLDGASSSGNIAFVEVLDHGRVVGKAFADETFAFTPVITWQGNEQYGLDGFTPGDRIEVRLLDLAGNRISAEVVSVDQLFGQGAYADLILKPGSIPTAFSVSPGYPNPFNPSVTVPFALPKDGEVSFAVFNLLGQQVYSVEQQYTAGYHRLVFDANSTRGDLVSGIYFLQVHFQGKTITQKMMLLK